MQHFKEELSKLPRNEFMPIQTLSKLLLSVGIFLLWAVLRFQVVGYGVDEESLDTKDKEALGEIVSEMKEKKKTRFSLTKKIPEGVKNKIFVAESIDFLLYASLLPLLALGTNWKFD